MGNPASPRHLWRSPERLEDRLALTGFTSAASNAADLTSSATISVTAVVISTVEGATFSGPVATFTDSNPAEDAPGDFTASIDWGDGATTAGTITAAGGGFNVSGSHQYADESTNPVVVTISDSNGNVASVTDAATVGGSDEGTLIPVVILATEGELFSGSVAKFTDDGNPLQTADDFIANIAWGDGATTTATVTGNTGGPFTISGSHTYSDEGTYKVAIAFSDDAPSTLAVTFNNTAIVSDAALTPAALSLSPIRGGVFSGSVATFTDDDSPATVADFTASIDWGDGSTTAGTITLSNGLYTVTGNHIYVEPGEFDVGIFIHKNGGGTVSVTDHARVQLTPHQLYVSAVYRDVLARAPEPGGFMYWTSKLDSGAPITSVAAAIGKSGEYYANFVIKPDYIKLLGRAADRAGVQYWTQRMESGLTDQQLAAQFAASDEFFNTAGGSVNQVNWIDAVYKLLLDRTAEPSGEKIWNNQLTALLQFESAIDARLDAALGITGSQENNTNLINGDYTHYLGRTADAGGLAYWLQQFADGATNEDVIAGFTGSVEYYKHKTGVSPIEGT